MGLDATPPDLSGYARVADLISDYASRTNDLTPTQAKMMDYLFTSLATKGYVDDRLSTLIGGAPAALDTLIEIANKLSADDDALAAINSAITALQNSASFVTTSIITRAQVKTQYPAGAAYRGKYVRVSDLFGVIDGVLRCGYNGRIYYWEATTQPTFFAQQAPSGSFTIGALDTPPLLELTAGPPTGVTWTGTFDLTDAWPGKVWELRGPASAFLGTLNLVGSGLGSALSLTVGQLRRFACYDTGTALAVRQLT